MFASLSTGNSPLNVVSFFFISLNLYVAFGATSGNNIHCFPWDQSFSVNSFKEKYHNSFVGIPLFLRVSKIYLIQRKTNSFLFDFLELNTQY